MNRIFPQFAILGLLLFTFVGEVGATAEYDYKPGELLPVKGGESPDKKFTIVSGDSDKKGGFGGVYLMDAQTKKVLGELKDVATTLDSAPEAYRAHWSPDSKHVGISSRAESAHPRQRHLSNRKSPRVSGGNTRTPLSCRA